MAWRKMHDASCEWINMDTGNSLSNAFNSYQLIQVII